jgi:hypothetical protein
MQTFIFETANFTFKKLIDSKNLIEVIEEIENFTNEKVISFNFI